jgi:Putative Flp pilus-assembly TadE/G-like
VLFAGGLTLIALLIGLVVDGGTAFANRRDAQNDADLAAMAGTKIVKDFYLTDPNLRSSDVYAAIDARMTANHCVASGGTPCSWTADYINATVDPATGVETVLGPVASSNSPIPPGTLGVVVHVTRQPSTFFLGIIGQPTWRVAADATAKTFKITTVEPGAVLPIGINPPNPFLVGESYMLTDNAPYGPGAFGWLSWQGGNATDTLSTSICTPDNDEMSTPLNIVGEPGAHNSSQVRYCLDQWILLGTPVLIPVFDTCAPCNGNGASFHITGFASFVITSYDGSGPAITNVTGIFLGAYSGSSVPAGSGTQPPKLGDPGAALQLTR